MINGPEVFDNTAQLLNKMSELALERHRVISNNIANVNTPGFKRKELDFEQILMKFVDENDMSGLEKFKGIMTEDTLSPSRIDGNNVDLGLETNDLLQNSMYHKMLNRALTTKLRIMKAAIGGGGR